MCRPCKQGDCDDCVRPLWHGEGCSHDCYSGRQLGLFAPGDLVELAPATEVVEHQAPEELDW